MIASYSFFRYIKTSFKKGVSNGKDVRRAYMQSDARTTNQVKAWRAHKNVMLTIPNPDKKNTKERFLRVPAIDVWGYPRDMQIKMR